MDAAAWALAIIGAVLLRYDFDVSQIDWLSVLIACLVAALLQLLLGWRITLYGGRFVLGSFHEARALALVVGIVGVLLASAQLISASTIHIPRSSAIIAVPLAFVLMGGLRYLQRVYVEGQTRPDSTAQRTLVYGAGYLAKHLVHRMRTDALSPYLPVGLVDDDAFKSRFSIDGVRVLGTGDDLAALVAKTRATALVISIGHADAALIRKISDAGEAAGLRVLVLPLLQEILEGKSRLSDLREVAIEDLIGRNPIDTHVETVADYLTGKRVLVTGAGGSIGSELSRQIAQYDPAELILLDHDETNLQTTEFLILGHGLMETKETVLADIRDEEALEKIFTERRPEVVFHTAALKHLPVLERYPEEGWKTNVLGTLNVLKAAMAIDVQIFVNVSTDKAADPTSVLGYSKRLGEQLTAWAAEQSGRRYLSVRFGNVLGSRGSLLPIVSRMIESGGPVTVTHADATRYFMTIPEASHLVIQAGGIGSPGQVLILDMGEPVRILDIVERMIARSGRDVGITFTGLRDGEKLHEVLMGESETDQRPIHPKISHATVPALEPAKLEQARWDSEVVSR
ncbi:nucleoside-diphosphate sugar epimerase/dehydratase [Parafrigoribacterium mesophilum]|uniref:nucleoside-diphosphate sugar epimerase/dehydratase n=1 Tax=Parafrigoribacterium mesophilum TaxID=433646 RepID=UPI0031FD2098